MNISQSIEIMKAIADPSRMKIINSLMEKPQYVEELAARINLAASTISFHLNKMEKVGLLKKEKDQYYVVYSINDELFNLKLREFVSFQNIDKFIQEERISKYRRKVISTFFIHGKLERIPAQHKKRWIVLENIAEKFSEGKIYTEKEVDNIIADVYNDYCTIRRYFIDEGLMKRKDGKYWLVKSDKPTKGGLRQSYLESMKAEVKAEAEVKAKEE